MLKLLHISDLHFGPPYLPKVGEALLESAQRVSADIIVASGDFTQRAKPEQFAAAREYFDLLPPAPLVVCPGNHDIPLYRVKERLLTPYDLYRKYVSQDLESVLRRPDVIIASLNTTDPLRRITDGRITEHHLDFCRAAFQEVPAEVLKIVVAHHHFAPAPDYEVDKPMSGSKRAIDCFNSLGVDLILGGHLHRAYIGNSLDLYASNDRSSGIIIVQSGTTTSRRGRARETEKNSFNVLEIDESTIRITHQMFFDETGGFRPVSFHVFPRRNQQFLA